MTIVVTLTTNPRVANWVGERCPYPFTASSLGPHVSQAVTRDDELIGGIVYHNWNRSAETCILSAAARTPGETVWTREVIYRMFEFPFRTCQLVWATHRADSLVRRLWQRIGGEETVVRRMYGRDADGVIHTFTVEEWLASPIRRSVHGRDVRRSPGASGLRSAGAGAAAAW